MCLLAFDGALLHVQGLKRVLERQAARVLYQGEARQTLPPIGKWSQLMTVGESPKVAISSPAQSG